MKHFFIINPIAGRNDSTKKIEAMLSPIFEKRNIKSDDYIIYVTKGTNDATIMVKRYCAENESKPQPEDVTFYVCGGDGTCFEVVNGIVGFPHARMTIIPVGSCNDFLKVFKDQNFMDIEALIDGEEKEIDVLKVNDRYTLNVANVGFDAKVNYDCVRFRYKYKTVKQSYNHAIMRNLFSYHGDLVKITSNDEKLYNRKALLMTFANGGFYGGGYNCAPRAKVDDGLLEMVVVNKISILSFARLVKYYKNGEHIGNPRFEKIVTYKQLKKVSVESDNLLCLCLDGETFHVNKINIEILPKAIRFVFPKKI